MKPSRDKMQGASRTLVGRGGDKSLLRNPPMICVTTINKRENKGEDTKWDGIFFFLMRRPGSYPEACSSWHLQVVSLHIKSWTSLSASFAFCCILPCERAWRAAEAARGTKRLVCTYIRIHAHQKLYQVWPVYGGDIYRHWVSGCAGYLFRFVGLV